MTTIEVLLNSEVVGTFNKLTVNFRCCLNLKDILNSEEVQVAFVLEEGFFNIDIVEKYYTGKLARDPRFTIKFTLEDKDYFINRGALESMTSAEFIKDALIGRKALFYKIEGVGELIKPSKFPFHLLDKNTLVIFT